MNELFGAASGTATGAETATSLASAVGATKTITLKPPATARTCTVTAAVKKQSPIWLRSVGTGESTTTALTLSQPAGTQQSDVLVMVVASTSGGTFTPPPEVTPLAWTACIV